MLTQLIRERLSILGLTDLQVQLGHGYSGPSVLVGRGERRLMVPLCLTQTVRSEVERVAGLAAETFAREREAVRA